MIQVVHRCARCARSFEADAARGMPAAPYCPACSSEIDRGIQLQLVRHAGTRHGNFHSMHGFTPAPEADHGEA